MNTDQTPPYLTAKPSPESVAFWNACESAAQKIMDVGERLPIPTALYSCKFCAEDYSWTAEDLAWNENQNGWICIECQREEVGPKGITLHEYMERNNQSLRQRCRDLADRWQSSPPMNHMPDYTAQAFARELRAIIHPIQT